MRTLLWLTAVIASAAATIVAEDEPVDVDKARVAVPVRVFVPAPPPEPDPDAVDEMPEMRTPQKTRGVSPQYRSPRTRKPAAGFEEPHVRFVLPLRNRLLLVEAGITVDGLPFRMIREQRVDQILADLANPPKVELIETENTETTGAAETTSAAEAIEATVSDPASEPETSSDVSAEAPADEAEAAPADEPPKVESPEETPESPPAAPPRDDSITGRLRRYAAATRRMPSRDEVRWLLRNWSDGPALLILNENFQRIRGRQSPVFKGCDPASPRFYAAVLRGIDT